jgi:hypothetical protein
MRKLISSTAMFIATFLLLSIQLNNKPIFEHIYQHTSPLTVRLQNYLEDLVNHGLDSSKSVGEKIFKNSVPNRAKSKAPEENLSGADKAELENLIRRLN